MGKAAYHEITGPNGLLARCEPFVGNSLRGEAGGPTWWGVAPAYVREQYDRLRLCHGDVTYTVYSYATPVAFVFGDGSIWVPGVRYSVTTSKGQGYCRAWLNYASDSAVDHLIAG